MARALAAALALPRTELDSLWHGPEWLPRAEFEADVAEMLAAGAWVTEYQYRPVKARLLRRSVVRSVTRRQLYNGNVERMSTWVRASHPLRLAPAARRPLPGVSGVAAADGPGIVGRR